MHIHNVMVCIESLFVLLVKLILIDIRCVGSQFPPEHRNGEDFCAVPLNTVYVVTTAITGYLMWDQGDLADHENPFLSPCPSGHWGGINRFPNIDPFAIITIFQTEYCRFSTSSAFALLSSCPVVVPIIVVVVVVAVLSQRLLESNSDSWRWKSATSARIFMQIHCATLKRWVCALNSPGLCAKYGNLGVNIVKQRNCYKSFWALWNGMWVEGDVYTISLFFVSPLQTLSLVVNVAGRITVNTDWMKWATWMEERKSKMSFI